MKRRIFGICSFLFLSLGGITSAQGLFSTLEEVVQPIEGKIDMGNPGKGASGIRDFIINTVYDVGFPLVFAVGVLMAILGIVGLMFSDEESDRTKSLKTIARGVAGIVIIVSAKYLTYVFVGEWGDGGILFQDGAVNGISVAQNLYDKVMFPFIKIGFMLIAGVLFVMLLIRVLGFLFNPGEDNQKTSLAIIGRNAIGILLIIGSKFIVELIYGKKEDVVNPNATNIGEIGSEIFNESASSGAISLVYEIINRVVSLTSLIILAIIIWQAYQLLTNPEDESKLTQVSKSLMYIFIGILVIGLSYVIANVVLVA